MAMRGGEPGTATLTSRIQDSSRFHECLAVSRIRNMSLGSECMTQKGANVSREACRIKLHEAQAALGNMFLLSKTSCARRKLAQAGAGASWRKRLPIHLQKGERLVPDPGLELRDIPRKGSA